MKAEYISRTFTVKEITLSAPGKKPLSTQTTDIKAALTMYAVLNGIDPESVKIETVEKTQLYRMKTEDFLAVAESVEAPEKKADPKASEVK